MERFRAPFANTGSTWVVDAAAPLSLLSPDPSCREASFHVSLPNPCHPSQIVCTGLRVGLVISSSVPFGPKIPSILGPHALSDYM